jgi:hypothetical protein
MKKLMNKATEKASLNNSIQISRSNRSSDDIWREEPELIRSFIAARSFLKPP